MIKACFAALVALLAGFGPGADRQQRDAAVPEVISAELPVYPPIFLQARIEGVVVVRLTTDGGRVANVDVVSASSKFFQDPAVAAAFVKSWRFGSHAPTSFESRLRFSVRAPDPPCRDNDSNPAYELQLPTQLVAEVQPGVSCGGNSFVVHTSRVRGTLACDCPGGTLEGARVSTTVPQTGRPSRVVSVTTDAKGRYDLGELPAGEYTITIVRPGFEEGWFSAVVEPSRRDDDAEGIRYHLAVEPPVPPPPPAVVRHAHIPLYPSEARTDGIEGTVRLRITPSYEVELIDGPPALARAAIQNAKTWTYENVPIRVFEVHYRYRLTPGDCRPDQNPTVSMRLPTEIEITAKRRISCGSFFVAPHLER